jgi:light-regulated signal transduction histidine kinase (bacteriophytochrome)
MGVAASMSISLVKDQKLWGLIACHHQTAKLVPYEIRTICEFLGQVMALELSTKQENEDLERKLMLKSLQSQFIETLSYAEDFTDGLVQNREELLDLVGAEGAVICAAGHLTLMGKTPTEPEILNLLDWLQNRFENDLFVTNSLPALYPEALKFKQVASGLLALSITRIQKNYVLWFRPEVLQYVNWAGAAENPVQQQADGSLVLSPRQSFQLWQETVRDKSLPWQSWEIAGAIELRSAIVSIVLRKADELAAINLELERSNNELDAFAYIASHDLKEPLRGIYNYSTFLLEDYMNILDQEGIDKLETLIRLTKRMEDLINSLLHFSRLGRQELHLRSLDLNQLVHNVAEIFQMSQGETANIQILIPKELPAVRGDHILIEEVLTNLIGNAIKYNDQTEKRAEIGCLDSNPNLLESEPENSPFWTFYVRDNGIGIRDKHLDMIFRIFKRLHAPGKYGGGTGAGLTIVKKILELHGGKIWVESSYGEGSTFFFTLPV